MANDQIVIEIVAQDGQVVKVIGSIKKQVEGLGDDVKKETDGFIKSFEKAFGSPAIGEFATKVASLVPVVGILAVGVAAIGLALEETLKGEKINAINKQFEILSNQIGASSEALRHGLESAAQGMVSTTDILKSTNKFLIEFGNNAERIPEVFDLARKATALFGGEVTQNFEQLSQAILTGQTRGLKNFGIVIDQTQAYRDYAKSIGTTAEFLSEAGKRQAVLNAALEKGNTVFQNVNTNANTVSGSIAKLKVAFEDLFDMVAVKAEKAFGGVFGRTLNALVVLSESAAVKMKASFGSGTDQLEAQAQTIKDKITGLDQFIQRRKEAGDVFGAESLEKSKAKFVEQLNKVENELERSYQRQQAARAAAAASGAVATEAASSIDLEARKKASERFLELLANENIKANEIRINSATDTAARAQAIHDQEMAINAQFEAEKAVLQQQYFASGVASRDQYNQLIIDKEIEKNEKLRVLQEKSMVTAMQINKSFNSALGAGIASGVASFTKSLLAGENAFSAFGKSLFGMIADIAVQMGTFFIMQGTAQLLLFSNPATAGAGMIAWGAGLVAFGVLLKALSGGAGAGAPAGGGAGGGGGGIATEPSSTTSIQSVEEVKPKTEVMINIEGNVWDRRQTGLEIVDVLNEFFDTNDGVVART